MGVTDQVKHTLRLPGLEEAENRRTNTGRKMFDTALSKNIACPFCQQSAAPPLTSNDISTDGVLMEAGGEIAQ